MPISTGPTLRFSSVTGRLAASLLTPALLLWLAAGCSSMEKPPADGSAGTGGSSNGDAAPDTSDLCASLPMMYAAAYQRAQNCDPTLSTQQCAQLVPSAVPCGACESYVNDRTELDQILAQYQAANCGRFACPAIACILPSPAVCLPVEGGTTGRCGEGPF